MPTHLMIKTNNDKRYIWSFKLHVVLILKSMFCNLLKFKTYSLQKLPHETSSPSKVFPFILSGFIIYDLLCPGFYPQLHRLHSHIYHQLYSPVLSNARLISSSLIPPSLYLEYLSYPFKYRFNLTVHYQHHSFYYV